MPHKPTAREYRGAAEMKHDGKLVTLYWYRPIPESVSELISDGYKATCSGYLAH